LNSVLYGFCHIIFTVNYHSQKLFIALGFLKPYKNVTLQVLLPRLSTCYVFLHNIYVRFWGLNPIQLYIFYILYPSWWCQFWMKHVADLQHKLLCLDWIHYTSNRSKTKWGWT
jgi:hypothetical protein